MRLKYLSPTKTTRTPYTSLDRPLRLQILRLSGFLDNQYMNVVRSSALYS
jgi:hypothetical protein